MSYQYDPYAPTHPHRRLYSNDDLNPRAGSEMVDFQQQQQQQQQPQPPYRDEVPNETQHQRNQSTASRAQEFDPFAPPPKSTGDLRMWRHDHHGNLWLKGGRGRCIGRFCCCGIMTVLLLLVSILLTLIMFLRPPDIEFSGIQPVSSGSAVDVQSSNLTVNLGIGISVRNPNYFSVAFKSIKATIIYPIRNTKIGGGEQDHVVFPSNAKTTFTFPFKFQYDESADPDQAIIKDIMSRCGFLPGSVKSQLSLDYTLQLAVQILFVTISPPISGTASFDCPFTQAQVQPLLDSLGLGGGGGGGGGGI